MDTLRAIRNEQIDTLPSFELSMRNNQTVIRNDKYMVPVVTALPFPAHLQLVYFQSDGKVARLFPTTLAQDRTLRPGAPVPLAGWQVGRPFGMDMMVAVVSSETLPIPLATLTPDTYLEALRRSADQAIHNGSSVLVRAAAVQITP
jgi:hypothetical protein